MNEKIENKFSSSIDIKDDKGKVWGAVFVSISKELGKRDIILIDENSGNYSFRSITELINMLSKKNISFYEKRRVLEFLSERLRILEKDSKIKPQIPNSKEIMK
ncbi:MAG: hypothetical protein ACLPWD_02220 [Methanobacterium sp.]